MNNDHGLTDGNDLRQGKRLVYWTVYTAMRTVAHIEIPAELITPGGIVKCNSIIIQSHEALAVTLIGATIIILTLHDIVLTAFTDVEDTSWGIMGILLTCDHIEIHLDITRPVIGPEMLLGDTYLDNKVSIILAEVILLTSHDWGTI